MQRAKRLMKGLRFYHLGFGLFWTVTFIILTGFQNPFSMPEAWRAYTLSEQLFLPLGVALVGIACARHHRELPPQTATAASFCLSGAAFLYFCVFRFGIGGTFASLIAGMLMGIASALFFLLWEMFYASEGRQRSIIYIPLSAVLSIGLYLLLNLLPTIALAFAAVIVFPYLSLSSLQKSLSEIEMYTISTIDRSSLKQIANDLWQPVLCVTFLGFIWKFTANPTTADNEIGTFAVLGGFAAAALLVVALELFSTKGFDLLRIYQLIFPLLTTMFLVPTLFGEQYTILLEGIVMFSFEVMNLLLIITCAVYTADHMLPPSPLYALCIAPVLVCMGIGDAIGSQLSPTLTSDFAHRATILLICIALLSVILAIVARSKQKVPASLSNAKLIDNATKRKEATVVSEQQSHEEHGNERQERIRAFFRTRKLSPRETEVAELLMKGHGVAAISNKLFISENTTRGHAKSIYKKLNIHSRQELIDLAETIDE